MIQTIADALAKQGYDKLTSVQEAVTDPALAEADLLVSAQTGSGKTVAFGMAIASAFSTTMRWVVCREASGIQKEKARS